MKKVLMVGAGIGQLFLSQKIKDRGCYLVSVTLPGKQPVIDIADKVHYHDVFDKEGVLQIAQMECVDAVISDQNDTMMPTVAYVADKMRLHGLGSSQADAYCNKNHFRDNCDKLGIPVPKHVEVKDVIVPDEFKQIPFPWIVKPADSQSSVGVEKVNSLGEYLVAVEKALSYSRTHSTILEEFFLGQEMVAEGFIYQGKYYNLGFADRKYFSLDKLFIPSQTLFPSLVDEKVLAAITACEERMAAYIQPEYAIVHSEYLYNAESGEFRVVESALRGGGVYISSHLIPAYTGVDINETLIDCMLGLPVDMNSVLSQRNNQAAGYICFYLPEGTVMSVSGIDEVKLMPSVLLAFLDDFVVGMETHKLTHKGQRMGPILVKAESRDALEVEISKIQNTLKAEVVNAKGEVNGIIWK